MGVWETVIPGLASIAPQIISAERTNAANRDIANSTNEMNQANAREQMAFQERMANSVHQREVEDLKKAGLNPILSANGGAPAPSGAAGANVAATMKDPLEGVATTALEVMRAKRESDRLKAETKLMQSQTLKNEVDAKVASKGIPEADIKNKFYKGVEPLINKLIDRQDSSAKSISVPVKILDKDPIKRRSQENWNKFWRN